jgi:glycosyltransferase involved in cell wall biosynthesis
MSPKVSVVIPAYNHERYVGPAIESVLGQTAGDLELIVIDDASADATWEVVQSYSDGRIRASRHEQNQGAVKTLNEGLRLARGEYLTLLNSDDAYHPERLQALLEAVDGGAEFVATDVELLEGDGEVMRGKGHGWIEWFEGLKDVHRWAGDPAIALLSGNLAVSTSNMFFAAAVPRRIGHFYEYRYAHDYEFLLRYLADPEAKFCFLDGRKLLSYRLHGANTITESGLAASQEVFGLLARWLADLAPLSDRSRVAALARQIVRAEGEIEEHWRRRLEAACGQAESWRTATEDTRREAEGVRREAEDTRRAVEDARREIERLEAEAARWRGEAGAVRAELDRVRGSRSFRLGSALLGPVRLARRLLLKAVPGTTR